MRWDEVRRRIVNRISDDGLGSDAVNPGNGLRGIRERVSALGGDVAWQSRPYSGFDLGVTIPWEGD